MVWISKKAKTEAKHWQDDRALLLPRSLEHLLRFHYSGQILNKSDSISGKQRLGCYFSRMIKSPLAWGILATCPNHRSWDLCLRSEERFYIQGLTTFKAAYLVATCHAVNFDTALLQYLPAFMT